METAGKPLYTLNTDNKDALTFTTEELGFTILGGTMAAKMLYY